MILPDREIRQSLDAGILGITPPPPPEAYSSTSVDLTLDESARTWRKSDVPGTEPVIISPGTRGFNFDQVRTAFTEPVTIPTTGYVLEPGQFLLAWTRERLTLPVTSRLAARVEGKSSLARCGVGIHVTAPTIHAGFEGQIQLEMFNHSTLRIRLLPGMRICQLIVEMTLGTPEKGYKGIFAGQSAASPSAGRS